ncbi:MAG: hypothetical protein QXJ74_01325 [Nitrososphaera sp.]|nr:hypothetical protein [Nitrososphaera sp.]
MAETQVYMYAVTIGVMIFLTGILFGTRARRPHGSQATQVGSS